MRRVVYTKIVGDLFHAGHVAFLQQARALGDALVVHVVDDERVTAFKRPPVMTHAERMAVVAGCRWVDEVLPDGPRTITLDFLDRNGYALYAFAWVNERELETKLQDCPGLPPERIGRVSYTPGISTTQLIKRIQKRLGGPNVSDQSDQSDLLGPLHRLPNGVQG